VAIVLNILSFTVKRSKISIS